MKKLVLLVALLLFLWMFLSLEARAQDQADRDAITQTALDYIDGAHAGSAARMERAVHPELCKVTPQTIAQTGRTLLRKAGSTRLIQIVGSGGATLAEDKRNIQVEILDVREGLAMVKASSAKFWDYLQIANIDGEWKIINVLWINRPKEEKSLHTPADEEAIKAAALNYIEGSFSGDAERMERALHPELNKVIPVKVGKTGKTMLDKMGASMLIEGTRAKMGMVPEGKRNIEFTLLDIKNNIAMARVLSSRYYDYVQVAKFGDSWKIVNVLWVMNPNLSRSSQK
jgi:hypothetical protein